MLGIIIQARMGSTRLPNKMKLPFYGKKGLFETLIVRIKESNFRVPIVVATTNNPIDDDIVRIAEKYNISVFRGSESDVLDRFIKAGEKFHFNKIIRICADNPFLDMSALDKQIRTFQNSEVDYWCYSLSNNVPTIKTHYGFWAEGIKLSTLKEIAHITSDKTYHEHVTSYVYTHPIYFTIHYEYISKVIEDEKYIRLTIDTKQDFELSKKIYSYFQKSQIPIKDLLVVDYVKSKPELLEIMKDQIVKNQK